MDEGIIKILTEHESKALDAIKIDKAIDCDPYENVGKLLLIRKILKQITDERRIHNGHA